MSHKPISKLTIWTGRVLSGLAVLFLLFDGIMKFFMDRLPPEALEAGAALQWPIKKMPLVGTILLICTLLYIIPRTSVLGAVLLTGYLGGAIASHVRVRFERRASSQHSFGLNPIRIYPGQVKMLASGHQDFSRIT